MAQGEAAERVFDLQKRFCPDSMVQHTTKSDVYRGGFVIFLPVVISNITIPLETGHGLITTYLSVCGNGIFTPPSNQVDECFRTAYIQFCLGFTIPS